MGFLGLTFATAMCKQRGWVAAVAIVLGPAVLVVGGFTGDVVASGEVGGHFDWTLLCVAMNAFRRASSAKSPDAGGARALSARLNLPR
jgi:hypothetical protein